MGASAGKLIGLEHGSSHGCESFLGIFGKQVHPEYAEQCKYLLKLGDKFNHEDIAEFSCAQVDRIARRHGWKEPQSSGNAAQSQPGSRAVSSSSRKAKQYSIAGLKSDSCCGIGSWASDLKSRFLEGRRRDAAATSDDVRPTFPKRKPLHASGESVVWLNDVVGKLWPKIDEALQKKIKEDITPLIKEQLPFFMKNFSFERCSFGNIAPELGTVRMYEREGGIELRVLVEFMSKADMLLNVVHPVVKVGIDSVSFRGDMSVLLWPLLDEFPVVGGIVVSFLDPPRVALNFQLNNQPLLRRTLEGVIKSAIAKQMVLPNVIAKPMAPNAVKARLQNPAPKCALRVTCISAADLDGVDWHLFRPPTSDPFVRIRLGADTWSSATVRGTCWPRWTEDNTHNFLIFDFEQEIELIVFDQDGAQDLCGDQPLGKARPFTVADALDLSEKDIRLFGINEDGDCDQTNCGTVKLKFELMTMAKIAKPHFEHLVLLTRIDSVLMPESLGNEVGLRHTLGSKTETTPIAKLQEKQDEDNTREYLERVARRCKEYGISVDKVEKVTGLPRSRVQEIRDAQDGKGEKLHTIQVEKRMFVTTHIDEVRKEELKLALVDRSMKTIGSTTVSLREDIDNGLRSQLMPGEEVQVHKNAALVESPKNGLGRSKTIFERGMEALSTVASPQASQGAESWAAAAEGKNHQGTVLSVTGDEALILFNDGTERHVQIRHLTKDQKMRDFIFVGHDDHGREISIQASLRIAVLWLKPCNDKEAHELVEKHHPHVTQVKRPEADNAMSPATKSSSSIATSTADQIRWTHETRRKSLGSRSQELVFAEDGQLTTKEAVETKQRRATAPHGGITRSRTGPITPSSQTEPEESGELTFHHAKTTSLLPNPEVHEPCSLGWMNMILKGLWQHVDKALFKYIKQKVEPSMQSKVPHLLKGIHFGRFSLGTIAPTLGDMQVFWESEGFQDHELKLRMTYEGNADVSINTLGVSIGLKSFKFRGDFIIRFNPILGEIPVIGGIVMCFLDPPMIDFDLTGLASVCDAPVIAGIVRKTMNSAIAEKLVLPNIVSVPIGKPSQGVDIAKLHAPRPEGKLRITVVSAKNLIGADWHFFSAPTSDPYVMIRLSDTEFHSTTVKRTCNPEWPEGNTHDFLVYDLNQSIMVDVYDEDIGKPDDFIGRSRPLRVSDAVQRLDQDVQLFSPSADPDHLDQDDPTIQRGTVRLKIEWFEPKFRVDEQRELIRNWSRDCNNKGDDGRQSIGANKGIIDEEGIIVVIARWVKLPQKLGLKVGLEVKLGECTRKSPDREVQAQQMKAVNNLHAVKCQVVKKCTNEANLGLADLARIAELDHTHCHKILAGTDHCSLGHEEDESLKINHLDLDHRIFLPVSRKQCDNNESCQVSITSACGKHEPLAQAEVVLKELIGKGEGIEVRPRILDSDEEIQCDIKISIIGLTRKRQISTPREKTSVRSRPFASSQSTIPPPEATQLAQAPSRFSRWSFGACARRAPQSPRAGAPELKPSKR